MYTRRKPLSLASARLPQTRNGLEKSGERAGDTRTHRGQRERLQEEKEEEEEEREGMGGLYRALCHVKEHRFSGSRSRVFDIEMGRTRLSPSCFADVGRFNPPDEKHVVSNAMAAGGGREGEP